jgi:hypothetical protein
MPRFRKKPVEIEAMQYPGMREHAEAAEVLRWLEEHGVSNYHDRGLIIRTLEGDMLAQPGDWIIKGVQGEFYPCKPDIFEATYESANIPEDPLLGLATTRQLLSELQARAEVGGYADYSPVDDDA